MVAPFLGRSPTAPVNRCPKLRCSWPTPCCVTAALVPHPSLGTTTANRQQFGSYDLAPGESVALQFSLPVQSGKFLLERLNLNVDARLRGPGAALADYGTIQFFNWRTSEWEE